MAENYEALVARIRYHVQKADFMGLKEHEGTLLLKEAADAIEGLLAYCNNQEDAIKDLVEEHDKVERKHGKWIENKEESEKHIEPIFICSACENMEAWGYIEKNTYKFCPHCGADMSEAEDEDGHWA